MLRFDDFCVETRNFKLFKGEATITLEPKTFLLLTYLIENRGRLVEKRELLDAVWKDVAVAENALTREIGKLRRSLGDDPKTPKYIETVHTRGYRFLARVETAEAPPEALIPTGEPPPDVRIPVDTPARGGGRTSRWIPFALFAVLTASGVVLASAFLLARKQSEPATARSATRPQISKTIFANPGSTSLAVLPFQPLGVPEDKYAGLAMADALITKLSNSRQLTVMPLSTILHSADSRQDSLSIGRGMHVDYVLEGKYQKLGDHTRVTVQLLCIACDGASRWAASFDETSADFFQVQDSISQKVVSALPLELSGEEHQRMVKRETNRPESLMAVFKGKLMRDQDSSSDALEQSIAHFQLAVSRDPNYASGWALLADSYRRREWYGGDPAQFLTLVRNAARKANELDPNIACAHAILGLIAFQYDWDFPAAEREHQRTSALQPSFMHQWYARLLLATNRVSEAEAEYKRFVARTPFSIWGGTHYAEFLYLTGQYSRAIEEARRNLSMNPDFAPALEVLGLAYEQQGLKDQAEEAFKKASGLSNGLWGLAPLGHLYATAGRLRHTQDVFDDMRAHRSQYYVSPYKFAVIHAALGYKDRALSELEQAYREHSLSAQALRFDPRLNDLRRDSGYREFAKKLGVF